jgi:hypothetical protein
MSLSSPLLLAATALAAVALAWWPWRGSLEGWAARGALAARAIAILALLLLIVDPGIRGASLRRAAVVLLDNSVSMHATGGGADSAAVLAASLGAVTPFAELFPGEPGGRSALGEVLATAVAQGRPIAVVTDGELVGLDAIPPDLLAQASVHLVPRTTGPDLAVVDVRMPARVAIGDTLRLEVELQATGGWRDSATVEVRAGDRVLLARRVGFPAPDARVVTQLVDLLPAGFGGDRWLEIALADPDDGEPLDDVRWRHLRLTPSPGIVVLAEVPDWDARFLHDVLVAVTDAPVRGYIQLTPGRWREMTTLRAVTLEQVRQAAGEADLLAVRGDTTGWHTAGRARLLWPSVGSQGDWYLAPAGISPVSSAFAGIEEDSLPPVPEVTALPAGEWTAIAARQARRGVEVPVLSGTTVGGRTARLGAQGLYRWGFRGGVAEQAWRAVVAEVATWLLDAPADEAAPASPVSTVTQRGRPVRFQADRPARDDLPILLAIGDEARADTLRFDAEGLASLTLPVGRYRYRFPDGGDGEFAVEPYADELVPSAVGLEGRPAEVEPAAPRRSLRELLPFFLVAIAGFSTEWVLRRRVGLR